MDNDTEVIEAQEDEADGSLHLAREKNLMLNQGSVV